MSNRRFLTILAAAAIAAGSLAATTGGAAAKAPPPPHYKPLICIFFPSLHVCASTMPAPKKVEHKAMTMTAKPKTASKKY